MLITDDEEDDLSIYMVSSNQNWFAIFKPKYELSQQTSAHISMHAIVLLFWWYYICLLFCFLELVCNLKTFKILNCSLKKAVKLKFLSVSELGAVPALYCIVRWKCSCDLPNPSYEHGTFVCRHHYCIEWHCANYLLYYWCYFGGLPFHYQKHFKQAVRLSPSWSFRLLWWNLLCFILYFYWI